jgi:GTP cyclohydrolase II
METVGDPGFGAPDQVAAERGLAEFRSGRPVVVTEASASMLAVPVDGLNDEKLIAFKNICAPIRPYLLVTARRAGVLGIEALGPVGLALAREDGAAAIRSLATDAQIGRPLDTVPVGAAATAAILLGKFAHRLPALLVADMAGGQRVISDPPLMTVAARSITRMREAVISSLAIAGEASVPIGAGAATRFVVFRDSVGGNSVAVIVGEPDFSRPVPVRLHSACLTGDVFGSRRCDCGDQLRLAIARLEEQGGGIVLYLEQEGRGLGLANKMLAYRLQDDGLDTLDANTTLGFDDDERDYGIAARMLRMLGCTRILLLTNNPTKLDGLAQEGIDVAGRVPLHVPINSDNRRYLTAKATRAGHQLDHLVGAVSEVASVGGSSTP